MEKHPLALAAAILGATALASCIPPAPAPPPRFKPNPPYAPDVVSGESGQYTPTSPDPQLQPTRPEPPAPTATGGYPTAERTANPNEVLSPYEPYNVIDISGFKSGQLVKDPSNHKIFRVP